MSCRFETFDAPEDLLDQLRHAGWKQKLAFYRSLEKELSSQSLGLPVRVLAPCWPELLKETNLNALERAVSCLRAYVRHYPISNLRLRREVANGVISLARMGRPSLNANLVDIVTTLFEKEQVEGKPVQRVPFGVISDRLQNSRHPTFLPGSPSSADDEEEVESDNDHLTIDSGSMLLGVLVEHMRGCRKESFALCQQVVNKLQEGNLLTSKQSGELEELTRFLNGVMTGQTDEVEEESESTFDPPPTVVDPSVTAVTST